MENFVMLTPLDQQLQELAELEAEIAALKQHLADTAPPPSEVEAFAQRLLSLGIGLGLIACVVAIMYALGMGLYWVWAQLPDVTGLRPLDAFLSSFASFQIGLGGAFVCVGLAGYVMSLLDTPFSPILKGSVGFLIKAAILGAGMAVLGALGLTTVGSLGL